MHGATIKIKIMYISNLYVDNNNNNNNNRYSIKKGTPRKENLILI
jgi:hypothetical protein